MPNSINLQSSKNVNSPSLVSEPSRPISAISDAAQEVLTADNEQVRSIEQNSAIVEKTANTVQSADTKISQIRYRTQQYALQNSINSMRSIAKTAKSQIDSPQVLNSVDSTGKSNPLDAVNGISNQVHETFKGIIKGSDIEESGKAYLQSYADNALGELHQHGILKINKQATSDAIFNLRKTLPSSLSALNSAYYQAGDDKKAQQRAIDQAQKLKEYSSSLRSLATTPDQKYDIDQGISQINQFQHFNQSASALQTQGRPVLYAQELHSSNAQEVANGTFKAGLSGGGQSYGMPGNGKSTLNMTSYEQGARVFSQLKNSTNIPQVINQLRTSPIQWDKKASKIIQTKLDSGNGVDLLVGFDPSLQSDVDTINSSNSPEAITQAQNVLKSRAMAHGLPETSINLIPVKETESYHAMLNSSVDRDKTGKITNINLNPVGNNISNLASISSENIHVPAYGQGSATNVAKFLRLLPNDQNNYESKYNLKVNAISFDQGVQHYAGNLPVWKDEDGGNAIKNVSSISSLANYMISNNTYHLNELAVSSGIPRSELADAMATKAVLITNESMGEGSTGSSIVNTLKDIDKKNQTILSNFPVYSGHSNILGAGASITVSPHVVNNYDSSINSSSVALRQVGAAGKMAYNRYISTLTQQHGNPNTPSGRAQNEYITKRAKETAQPFSSMSIVSSNGLLKLITPNGNAITITNTDFTKGKDALKNKSGLLTKIAEQLLPGAL